MFDWNNRDDPRGIAIVRLGASDCCLVSAEALNIVSLGRVHANGMLYAAVRDLEDGTNFSSAMVVTQCSLLVI